jgi:hypothetical protein
MHLPAAGLFFGKIDGMPEALKELHRRAPGLWEERIIKAGDK